ncbi:MAG: S-layer homology domain-containing protein [Firmicutes bacterium]|nr:S-layer homology domain-containing protein [Bacillota bacterium]
MIKRFLAVLTIMAVLSPFISFQTYSALGDFSGGTGVANDPYLISTEQDLRDMASLINDSETTADYNDKHYSQTQVITLENSWGDVIGRTAANAFRGEYDGGGFLIANLRWTAAAVTANPYVAGLFGYVMGDAKITGVNIVIAVGGSALTIGGDSMAALHAGALAANVQGSVKITDCSVSGGAWKIESTLTRKGGVGVYVGGLIGSIENAAAVSVTGSYSEVNVGFESKTRITGVASNHNYYVGGFIGRSSVSAENAEISRCYSKGSVSADSTVIENGTAGASVYAGGFMAQIGGAVSDCYSTAETVYGYGSRNSYAGAFANTTFDGSTVTRCYSAGTIVDVKRAGSTATTRADLFIGGGTTVPDPNPVTGCYYGLNVGLYNQLNRHEVLDLPANQLKTQYAFDGFDFDNIWGNKGGINGNMPILKGVGEGSLASELTLISGMITSHTINVGMTGMAVVSLALRDATGETWINNEVTWTSSNTDIATVDGNGNITAVSKGGPVNITAAAKDKSSVTAVCTVTVTAASTPSININPIQNGVLTTGKTGTATFSVATANIANSSVLTTVYCSDAQGSVGAPPAGVTIISSAVSGNASTVTVSSSAATAVGTYYFKLTGGGAESNVAVVTVIEPIPDIIIHPEQIGALMEGMPGTVVFNVSAENIQDGTVFDIIFCTNASGSAGVQPTGLSIMVAPLADGVSTVTAAMTTAVAGTYYFKLIGGGTESNTVAIAVLLGDLFSGGKGTPEDPFRISRDQDIREMVSLINASDTSAEYSDKYYRQTQSIALTSAWGAAIGDTDATAFQGKYDGGGYSITNFGWSSASKTTNPYIGGLFGYVDGEAEISGVNIVIPIAGTTVNLSGSGLSNFFVSALAANIRGTTAVMDCSVTGGRINVVSSINRSRSVAGRVGGLIACIDSAASGVTIDGCHSLIDINLNVAREITGLIANHTYNMGGLIGTSLSASTTTNRCYSRGSVSGNAGAVEGTQNYGATIQVGGLMGTANGTITNCYAAAPSVSAIGSRNIFTGAFAGTGSSGYSISSCYTVGTEISAARENSPTGSAIMDVFMRGGNSESITNSYFGEITGATSNAALLTELVGDELRSQYAYSGFDFAAIPVWGSKVGANNEMPILGGVGEGNEISTLASIVGMAADRTIGIGDSWSAASNIILKDTNGNDWINNEVAWSSSDERVASVDSDGMINAMAIGTAVITVAARDKINVYKSCVVNVTATSEPDIEILPVQNGVLIAGTPGEAVFSVVTMNIDDGAAFNVIYCANADGAPGSQPGGMTVMAAGVTGERSVVTVNATGEISGGIYYFKLIGEEDGEFGGAESNVASIVVSSAAPAITVEAPQMGEVKEGTAGMASFNLTTANITSGAPIVPIYCDNEGNDIGAPPNGIIITAHADLVTVTVSPESVTGTYYFKLASCGAESNLASLVLTPAPRINIATIQSKLLVQGIADAAVIDVIAANIPDNTPLEVIYCTNSAGEPASQPVGITITANDIVGNTSKIYVTTTEIAAAGMYYFKLTGGEAVSINTGAVVINEATITIGRQMGNVTERVNGRATYEVETTYIPNDTALDVLYCNDAAGTVIINEPPAGVDISVSDISNNTSLITALTTTDTASGTYFFRLTSGNAISNTAVLNIISRGASSDVVALISALDNNAAYYPQLNCIALTQSAVLGYSAEVPSGTAMIIPSGMTLTISEGITLTVSENSGPLVLEGNGSRVETYGILNASNGELSIADGAMIGVFGLGGLSYDGVNIVGTKDAPSVFTLGEGANMNMTCLPSGNVCRYSFTGVFRQNIDHTIDGGRKIISLQGASLIVAGGVSLTLTGTAAEMDSTSSIFIAERSKLAVNSLSSIKADKGAVIKAESAGGLVTDGGSQAAGVMGSDGMGHWLQVPGAPVNLMASGITQTSLTLSWTIPEGSVTGYSVYMNRSKFQAELTATSLSFSGLAPYTSYTFEVTADNNGVSSEPAVLSVRTLSASGLPGSGGGGGSSGRGGSVTSVGINIPLIADTQPTEAGKESREAFKDVPGHWAYVSIMALYDLGIVNGGGDGDFYPQNNITRAEFIKMTLSAFDIQPSSKGEISFADIDSGEWYAPWVVAAAEAKIITGYTNGLFGANDFITREDAATVISRVAGSSYGLQPADNMVFMDEDNISEYAKEAVALMKTAGIISGYPDGTFLPKNNLTRAESAKMIEKAIEIYVSK